MTSPSRLKVLLVDDSTTQRDYLRYLLADQPFILLEASNGREALQRVRQYYPDIILMDIEMPEMDGVAASQELRTSNVTAGIPVIMISARTDEDNIENAFIGGCSDYITKPVHKQDLLSKIRSLTGHTLQQVN